MAATSPEVLVDQPGPRVVDRDHIAALTGLRGFAAMVVVVVHASAQTSYPWVGLHGYGPIALFVLSGFLLFQPWSKWMLGAGRQPELRSFFWRRVMRIFPAFLACFLVVALIYPSSRPARVQDWITSLTLTQTLSPTGLRPGMEHTWSLSTELSWYLLLPLIGAMAGWLVTRRGVRASVVIVSLVALAAAGSALWRWHIAANVTDLSDLLTMPFWLPGFLICFVGGAAIGHVVVLHKLGLGTGRVRRWLSSHVPTMVLLAVVCAGVANSHLGGAWGWTTHTSQERAVRFAFTTLMALLLLGAVATASSTSLLSRVFASRAMVAIGRWSYGIYLWHLPAREIISSHMSVPSGPGGLLLWIALQFAVAVPLGAITYGLVERPAIAFAKRQPMGALRTPRDAGPQEASAKVR